jgi:hypothetical protein
VPDSGHRIAVVGIGLALVALALAAGLGFVSDHDPPRQFWTLASGLAGGLLGLVAPAAPSIKVGGLRSRVLSTDKKSPMEEAADAHTAAALASRNLAETLSNVARDPANDPETATKAAAGAAAAATAATKHAQAAQAAQGGWLALGLLICLFLGCEYLLLYGQPPHHSVQLLGQLQAIASAAAGAAIGLLAPSPAR